MSKAIENKARGFVVLVIDNAPCHSNIEEILEEEEFREHKILRLAPYSPILNPIENVWSVIKAFVKRNLAIRMPQILQNEAQSGLSKSEFRLRELERKIRESIPEITPTVCASFAARILRLLPRALNLEDMEY